MVDTITHSIDQAGQSDRTDTAVFPAKLGHRHAAFGMAQDRKDLWFAISRHLHLNLLVYLAEKILLPQPLLSGGITMPRSRHA